MPCPQKIIEDEIEILDRPASLPPLNGPRLAGQNAKRHRTDAQRGKAREFLDPTPCEPWGCPRCGLLTTAERCVRCFVLDADKRLLALDAERRFRFVRVLRVIAARPGEKATTLQADLGMEPGQLRPLVETLEGLGLVLIDNQNSGCRPTISTRGERWLADYESEPPRCQP